MLVSASTVLSKTISSINKLFTVLCSCQQVRYCQRLSQVNKLFAVLRSCQHRCAALMSASTVLSKTISSINKLFTVLCSCQQVLYCQRLSQVNKLFAVLCSCQQVLYCQRLSQASINYSLCYARVSYYCTVKAKITF